MSDGVDGAERDGAVAAGTRSGASHESADVLVVAGVEGRHPAGDVLQMGVAPED